MDKLANIHCVGQHYVSTAAKWDHMLADVELPDGADCAPGADIRRCGRGFMRRTGAISEPTLSENGSAVPAAPAGKNFRCPFNESNTSTADFLAKLRDVAGSSKSLPDAEPCGRVVVIQKDGFVGECAGGRRIFEGLTAAGCECCLCSQSDARWIDKINPSLAITMHHSVAVPQGVMSALVHTVPQNGTTGAKALKYDAVLYSTPDIDNLESEVARSGNTLRAVQFFPSVKATEFFDKPKERLAYAGVNWDRRRRSSYAKLWNLLDGTGYFDVYGPQNAWKRCAPKSYRGFAKWDNGELLSKLQSAGIVLVLHADQHLSSGTPAWRVFEAAASSAVMICDRNKFVVDNFGDSVLYVDHNVSPEEMFAQIDGHVRWLRENPEKAMAMARRSHAIFLEKFTLEKQIDSALKLLREIAAEKSAAAK
ncbi:MAG: glycosyltransferase [Puniceicoccales bacterium]|jgi:hypothetical protein|nr:glycosyltransferase [Puniceicoccales bacterium]